MRQHRRGFDYSSFFNPILMSLLSSVCLGLFSIACNMSLSVLLFSFNPMKVVFFFVHSLWAFDSGIVNTSSTWYNMGKEAASATVAPKKSSFELGDTPCRWVRLFLFNGNYNQEDYNHESYYLTHDLTPLGV